MASSLAVEPPLPVAATKAPLDAVAAPEDAVAPVARAPPEDAVAPTYSIACTSPDDIIDAPWDVVAPQSRKAPQIDCKGQGRDGVTGSDPGHTSFARGLGSWKTCRESILTF